MANLDYLMRLDARDRRLSRKTAELARLHARVHGTIHRVASQPTPDAALRQAIRDQLRHSEAPGLQVRSTYLLRRMVT
ncbi:MAG: hypothetical protein ABR562_01410 [Thermoplasmatota archaeon]